MEDGGSNRFNYNNQAVTKHRPRTTDTAIAAATRRHGGSFGASEENGRGEKHTGRDREADGDGEEGEGDPEVWRAFSKSFRQVQSVLDRNRVLIQQVNENHQSKIPDNLVKNVALIQEINGNISKVVSLYSDLSSDFSTMFHHQRNNKNGDGNGDVQLNDASQMICRTSHLPLEES